MGRNVVNKEVMDGEEIYTEGIDGEEMDRES